jgi:sugar lactone lactonase YvrE
MDAADTSGHSGGFITETLTDGISAYGVCYSTTNQTPTTADTKTTDTVNLVSFASKLHGLLNNTTYYLRAYATNVAGTGYGNVIKFTTGGNMTALVGTVSSLAGNASTGLTDGDGVNAFFNSPQGITTNAAGDIYVSDSFNSAIRTITPAGTVTTLTGNGTIGYVDGSLAYARFYAPQGIIIDGAGTTYIADLANNLIRKITAAGVVSTLAGSGTTGYTDATGIKAEFNNPCGLAFDLQGNIIVADRGNNLIRRVTPAGVVTTVAGNRGAGYANNTTATSASFNRPSGVTVDATGNIYVADLLNHAIRKITTAGVVSTLLGGPRDLTTVGYPGAVTTNAKGDMFIVDQNGRILVVTVGNVLLPLAGKSILGFADGQGTSALFSAPQAVTVDKNGDLWIADSGNNRIRKLVLPSGL